MSSSPSNDEDQPSNFREINENEGCVEFLSARCSPGLGRQENLSSSQAGQGIEITLLPASSSMRNSQSANESSMVLRDLFEPGASAGSLLGHCQSFDDKSFYHLNGTISAMEVLTYFGILLERLYFSYYKNQMN